MNTSEDPDFKRAMAESMASLNQNIPQAEEEKKEEEPIINPPLQRVPTMEDPEFLRGMQESLDLIKNSYNQAEEEKK